MKLSPSAKLALAYIILIALLILLMHLDGRIVYAAPQRSQLVYYRPGLMERVAKRRGLPPAPCYMSSPLNDRIGVRWSIRRGSVQLVCTQADVSHPAHKATQIRLGRLIEVDSRSAIKLCGKLLAPPECIVTFYKLE